MSFGETRVLLGRRSENGRRRDGKRGELEALTRIINIDRNTTFKNRLVFLSSAHIKGLEAMTGK